MKLGRRSFMKGGAVVPALALAPSALAASGALALFDPDQPASVAFAAGHHEARALTGDRVRVMQAVLARAPRRIVGLTHYADLLVVGDVAAEAGYRVAMHEVRDGLSRPTLHAWALVRA